MCSFFGASGGKSGKQKSGHQPNFAELARQQGWTKEQLRTSFDLPKKSNLKPGTIILRFPPDLLEDPFKGKPSASAEDEYNQLETRFYNKLSRVVKSPAKTVSSGTNRTNHVRVQITGARQSEIKLHVEKGSVDARINMTGDSSKSKLSVEKQR